MATKVISAKPGIWNGIEFRSQLEIKWAKWFDEHGMCWDYVDESTHDFELATKLQWAVEVKPPVASLCASAVNRFATFDEWPAGLIVILVGEPPSPYRHAFGIMCEFFTAARTGAPMFQLLPCYFLDPPVTDDDLNLGLLPHFASWLIKPGDERMESLCGHLIELMGAQLNGR